MNSCPIFSKNFLLVAGLLAASAGTLTAVSPTEVFSDPLVSYQWQWHPDQGGINIADVWDSGVTGEGVVIGITGYWVEPFHEDLNVSTYNPGTNWQTADLSQGLSYDFNRPGTSPKETDDQFYPNENAHETAGAGMAGAVGGNGVGLVGAAPGSTIAGLRGHYRAETFLWASGVAADGTYLGEAEIDVKNFYLGSFYGYSGDLSKDSVGEYLNLAAQNNVVFTCSAYNSRSESNHQYGFPSNCGWLSEANHASVINVAATDKFRRYASFSDYGANVFIAAPGNAVPSTDRTGDLGYTSGYSWAPSGNYYSFGGTSASGPLVAGVMALGKQVCPDMDARWAKHALAWSSGHNEAPNIDPDEFHYAWESPTGFWQKNNGGYWFNNNYGFGLVDPVKFVDATRDILYTTTGTTFTQTSAGIEKIASTETATGTLRTAEFSVKIGDGALAQNIETVSVHVEFSDAAQVNLDLTTLKVTLIAPDDAQSIVIQGSVGDASTTADAKRFSGYKFLSNAFWGASYGAENWRVLVEYSVDDGVNTTDWVSVDSVEFTQGEVIFEADDVAIAESESVNADMLALESGSFSVAGTMRVEDSVSINAGTFELAESGTLAAYTGGVFGAEKGVKYTQNGGSATIRGDATFKRGATLNGGTLNLYKTLASGTGMTVNGGTLNVGATGTEISVGAALPVYGGKLVLAENAMFGTALNVEGGSVEINNGATLSKKVAIGKNGEEAVGGSLSAAGTIVAKSGIEFAGKATGTFAKDTAIKEGGLTLSGGSVVWSGMLTVDGGITVSNGALGSTAGNIASYAGNVTNAGTLGISANASVVFAEGATFINGANRIDLASGSALRLESGISGNNLAGTLSGSGKLTLTQDTDFDANVDAFAGTLAIENGVLSVGAGANLNLATNAVLELGVSDEADWLAVNVASGGNVSFAEGSGLIVNFTGILGETSEFTVMNWADDASVSGLFNLERGDGIALYVGGVEYANDYWTFEVAQNSLKLKLDVVVVDIRETLQNAVLSDEGYIANFAVSLTEYSGSVSGKGDVNSVGTLAFSGNFADLSGTVYVNAGSFTIKEAATLGSENYVIAATGTLSLEGTRDFGQSVAGAGALVTNGNITLSGDASAHTGTTKVESGTLTIAQGAKLGTGAFNVAGTLGLVGDRTFNNASTGAGTLDVISGTTTFTTNVGTENFDISENAAASFEGTATGFSGKLTGAGTLATAKDFVLSGDASGFEGKTSVKAGTFTVTEAASLGTGDFEVAGTLALKGNRTFVNTTSGAGTLSVAAGTTTFMKNVGTAKLDISADAVAKFDAVAGFAGTLTGAGALTTEKDFSFSGDASGFSGKTSVTAGTFAVAAGSKLGSGVFEVDGVLALSGDRTFENTTSGKGLIDLVSGTTAFATAVGVAKLDISENAVAKFEGDDVGFSGTLTGAGALTTAKDFSLSGDASGFSGKTSVTGGTFAVASGTELGTGDFELAGNLDLDGTRRFSNKISGDGALVVRGDVIFEADASAFSGKTQIEQGGKLTLPQSSEIGSEFVVYGELNLEGTRTFANATSGSGTIALAPASNLAFANNVGAKTISVAEGATLRGGVTMTYGAGSRIVIAGELQLNLDKGETVVLNGGRAVLETSSSLNFLTKNPVAMKLRDESGVDKLADGETVSIFTDGIVEGDVLGFLKNDAILSDFAARSMVVYDLSHGLNVRVASGIAENADVDTAGLSESYLAWSMKDARNTFDSIQSGFWNIDDPVLSGGNDPLLRAILGGDSSAARAVLDRLSPKSYAAMVAMAAESFHSDVRNVASRLEQRRYDGFAENARWEFFAQAQFSSFETDTKTDSAMFDFDTNGVFAGADYKTSAETIVGIAFGADNGEAKIHNGGGKIESSDLRFTAYFGKTFNDRFYLNAGTQLGYANYDVKRKTDYGNARGDTHGLSGGVFAETGALLTLSEKENIFAMPYIGLAYTHSQIDGFEEDGTEKAFDADTIKGDSLRARIGCGFSWGFDLAGTDWRLGLDLAYSHDFLGDEVDVEVMSKGGDFIAETAKALPEDVFSAGPTLNVNLNSTMSIYGGYTFSTGTDAYTNHSANLGFRMRF